MTRKYPEPERANRYDRESRRRAHRPILRQDAAIIPRCYSAARKIAVRRSVARVSSLSPGLAQYRKKVSEERSKLFDLWTLNRGEDPTPRFFQRKRHVPRSRRDDVAKTSEVAVVIPCGRKRENRRNDICLRSDVTPAC